MIAAAAALRLPIALLNAEERAAVEKSLEFIEIAVRERMKYDGVLIDFPGIPRHIAVAITHRLGPDWKCEWTAWQRESKFSKNIAQSGFLLQLSPSDKAYAEAGERNPDLH